MWQGWRDWMNSLGRTERWACAGVQADNLWRRRCVIRRIRLK